MTTTTVPDWRENRRRDRLADAQIARQRDDARLRASLEQQRLDRELNREDRVQRRADRAAAKVARAGRWAGRWAWVREHAIDLLFVPVIGVPGACAWTAMADYGFHVFGPVGLMLPAFSEGAMWAFEARATWKLRHEPGRSVSHLRLGSWAFCAIGAALNFLHGFSAGGVTFGLVMAIVSAAGLVAHQIVNMGPRRTRLERAAARREARIRRAAVGRTRADLGPDGSVTLVSAPGRVEVTRKRGRTILTAVERPACDRRVLLPWPIVLPGRAAGAEVADLRADDAMTAYRSWRTDAAAGPAVLTAMAAAVLTVDECPLPLPPVEDRETIPAVVIDSPAVATAAAISMSANDREPVATERPSNGQQRGHRTGRRSGQKDGQDAAKRAAIKALRRRPEMAIPDLAKAIGRSERTARRIRAEIAPQLATASKGG